MKYVGLVRVSTGKQGKSGLGLEGQEAAIRSYVANAGGRLVKLFIEVESGKDGKRPVLTEAIQHAQMMGARLVIQKLDRLSRDLGFITTLQKTAVDFVVVDLPGADKFTIQLFGALGEKERLMISERTKAALAEAKKRGVTLGNPKGHQFPNGAAKRGAVAAAESHRERANAAAGRILPLLLEYKGQGMSMNRMAKSLNEAEVPSPSGKVPTPEKPVWTAQAVKNTLKRLGLWEPVAERKLGQMLKDSAEDGTRASKGTHEGNQYTGNAVHNDIPKPAPLHPSPPTVMAPPATSALPPEEDEDIV